MTVMNYDPNMTTSGRKATQKVRLTFGQWEYRYTTEVDVGGNCTGLYVIQCAIGIVLDKCYHQDLEMCRISMTKNGSEDVLECEDEDGKAEDWLESMLISAEIISIIPKITSRHARMS